MAIRQIREYASRYHDVRTIAGMGFCSNGIRCHSTYQPGYPSGSATYTVFVDCVNGRRIVRALCQKCAEDLGYVDEKESE